MAIDYTRRTPRRVAPERASQPPNPPAPAPRPAPDTEVSTAPERPTSLGDMIGQEKVRAQLMTMLRSAGLRGEVPGHVLLYGPPGLGKTTIGLLVASQAGGRLVTTTASAVNSPQKLARELAALVAGDVLFIDEIHGLSRTTEEALYSAMEDRRIEVSSGTGAAARSTVVNLEPFTLVGATTKAGKLSAPLRDRFPFVGALEYYSAEELSRIVSRVARLQDVKIEDEAADSLGRRSRGTPRIALNLFKRVRDYAISSTDCAANVIVTERVVDDCLALFEVDTLGLDPTDRLILRALCVDYSGGPVGVDVLAAATGQDVTTIADGVEPFMLRTGLMRRQSRGRVATKLAYQHLGLRVPADIDWR